jgi:hypothetical protein
MTTLSRWWQASGCFPIRARRQRNAWMMQTESCSLYISNTEEDISIVSLISARSAATIGMGNRPVPFQSHPTSSSNRPATKPAPEVPLLSTHSYCPMTATYMVDDVFRAMIQLHAIFYGQIHEYTPPRLFVGGPSELGTKTTMAGNPGERYSSSNSAAPPPLQGSFPSAPAASGSQWPAHMLISHVAVPCMG